jgi:AraC-like DNA-binding protein
VVTLLQPRAPHSKVAIGAGPWSVRRSETGLPFYCAVLEGTCRLSADGHDSLVLEAGDFVLIPTAPNFTMSSLTPPTSGHIARLPIALPDGEYRHGDPDGPPDVRSLIGYCTFGSPDAALLTALLPRLVHVRAEKRLAILLQLVSDETRAQRPARDVVLMRLLEVLFIEALRSAAGIAASPGLLRGLADDRVAVALRRMHESPAQHWTVPDLAREAALSRSAFFERFHGALGVAPMEYLLAWRMALAKDILRRKAGSIAETAEQVGYSSASTFTIAFTRSVGLPPARYAKGHLARNQ